MPVFSRVAHVLIPTYPARRPSGFCGTQAPMRATRATLAGTLGARGSPRPAGASRSREVRDDEPVPCRWEPSGRGAAHLTPTAVAATSSAGGTGGDPLGFLGAFAGVGALKSLSGVVSRDSARLPASLVCDIRRRCRCRVARRLELGDRRREPLHQEVAGVRAAVDARTFDDVDDPFRGNARNAEIPLGQGPAEVVTSRHCRPIGRYSVRSEKRSHHRGPDLIVVDGGVPLRGRDR